MPSAVQCSARQWCNRTCLLLPGTAKLEEPRAVETLGGGGLGASSSSNSDETTSTGIWSAGGDGTRRGGSSCAMAHYIFQNFAGLQHGDISGKDTMWPHDHRNQRKAQFAQLTRAKPGGGARPWGGFPADCCCGGCSGSCASGCRCDCWALLACCSGCGCCGADAAKPAEAATPDCRYEAGGVVRPPDAAGCAAANCCMPRPLLTGGPAVPRGEEA